jgi:hypothetical protein
MADEPHKVPAPTVDAWRQALYEMVDNNRNEKSERKEVVLLLEVFEEIAHDADSDPDFDWESGEINFDSSQVLRVARYNPDTFIATLIHKTGIPAHAESD